ncbi:MAG TPA: hypothetical protein VMT30_04550 [Candidatus Saccharimonadia bacterium]|nr:hypothetical protein [Candidatus Saccharimonadia bacterium]
MVPISLPEILAYAALPLLIGGGATFALTPGRNARGGAWLILVGILTAIAAGIMRLVAGNSDWAAWGCALVFGGLVLLLGSGIFEPILPGWQPANPPRRPSLRWIAAGLVCMAIGLVLIITQ